MHNILKDAQINSSFDLPAILPEPEKRHLPFPLTDMQQAYWVGRSGVFELGHVSTHFYFEIESSHIDIQRLNDALQQMIQRHGILRTIVLPEGQQQVLTEVPLYEINIYDLCGKPSLEIEAKLKSIRDQMSHQILPSDQWPLFEVRASRLGEQKIRLHLSLDMLTMDAKSQGLFFYEWLMFYNNTEACLPKLEISFRDYVMAEVASKKTAQYQQDIEYWRQCASSLPPGPDLPLKKNTSAVSQLKFTSQVGRLDAYTWARLKHMAVENGTTPSMVMLSAFSEILRIWSKNPEFTINITLLNRMARDVRLKNVMGNYTSSSLLGVRNQSKHTFKARTLVLQEQLRRDLQHSLVSGVEVLREINSQRLIGERILMPVVFTSVLSAPSPSDESVPTAWLGESAWMGENTYTISQTSQVWLDCQVREQGGALVYNWDAIEALFPEKLLSDMFAAYTRLLRCLADNDGCWRQNWPDISETLIPPGQLEQRAAINNTEKPVSEALLHTLFAGQVSQRPQQAAVMTPKRTIGYQELYDRANQVGHWLRNNGLHPNMLVAVVMEKGWEQVVGVMGVLMSGAAYLPIDVSLPKERLLFLLENGRVSIALTQSWHDEKIEWPESVQRLCVDQAGKLDLPTSPLEVIQGVEDLAYVVYTSGSTGLPKGVMIDHRGVVNTILDVNQRFRVNHNDRVLALSALNFDLSVYDIFGILAAGGTIVIPDAEADRNPKHWAERLVQCQVTIWNTVPALMQMLTEYLDCQCEALPKSLRLVMMSGDWIPINLPGRIKSITEKIEIVSLGGATEASIWSILYPIEELDPASPSIPYGKPMRNQNFHVLSEALTSCPTWVPGQLYIGGIGLAKGYWKDEEKTKAGFILHPQTGQRLYRTGDMGRYLPDGNIEFLGREDYQVKIGGYRIELGEIEAALLQHPRVRAAVVAAGGELHENKWLVAYIVPEPGTEGISCHETHFLKETTSACDKIVASNFYHTAQAPNPAASSEKVDFKPNPERIEELRSFLREKLPAYMVPGRFIFLEALPLSPNGKVDRSRLPEPGPVRSEQKAPIAVPRTQIEKVLYEIWVRVLEIEQIGIYDNFLDVGGHSLLAVQIIARVEDYFDIEMSVRTLFEFPTIAELAGLVHEKLLEMIEQLRSKGLDTDVYSLVMTPALMDLGANIEKVKALAQVPPNRILPGCDRITPELLTLISLEQKDIDRIAESTPGGAANIQDMYPLVPMQEGILFHYLLSNKSDAYILFTLSAFATREMLDEFLLALQAVIDRHDILRTAILWEDLPEPVQVVWRKASLIVEQVAIDPSAGDAVGQLRFRFTWGNFRIDIRKAPMMRAFIARDDIKDRWLLALPHHHLIMDHISLEILGEEIMAHLAGKASSLPAALPFRDFVGQIRLGAGWEGDEAFFRKMLEDVQEPTTPFGLQDVWEGGSDIVEARLPIDMSLSRRLRESACTLGVSSASVFHVAWARVLACLSGRDDVVFGTVLSARGQGGTRADRVLGVFINTLPVRIGIKDETVEQTVKTTHRMLTELLYHEHAPLALAQRCSKVPATMPLFSSLLNYRYTQPTLLSENADAIWEGMEILHEEERTNYPMVVSVDDLGEGFLLIAQVHSSVEPMRICEFMNTVIGYLVKALEMAPHTAVRSIEPLSQSERQRLLFDWNTTQADYPKDHCLHQLFEIQAEKDPDAVAVVFEDEFLTYSQLNHRANRLAHYLIGLGVLPDSRVVVAMERSLDMVVSLLAVLKAGGGYVPLDLSYPLERLSFMLEDTQANVLLTQQKWLTNLSKYEGNILCLDSSREILSTESKENPNQPVAADNLAYVIYTSGSTGKPKGVMIPHRAICNHMHWMIETFSLTGKDRVLQKTPFSFDASVWEFFAPLLVGGQLVMARPGGHQDGEYLIKAINAHGVTIVQMVPSLLRILLASEGIETCSSLRHVFCGGEPLPLELQERFFHCLNTRLCNLYGPTEAAIDTTYWVCQRGGDRPTVPIGRPIANVKTYVLDFHRQPVPIGVSGELYIGGDGLAMGYLNQPEMTAERFIPDPFSHDATARLYKTGDLVRYLPDTSENKAGFSPKMRGVLEFLGRLDHQVKIRGFRIELGEIEASLEALPGIETAIVTVWEESPGDKRLAAYMVAASKDVPKLDSLGQILKRKLPAHMIPACFVWLNSMPLLPNGKVDRKALPAPTCYAERFKDCYVAPVTPVEEKTLKIFTEVLAIEKIGVLDNFFNLGGHSLLATRAVSKIREQFQVEISLRDFFENPTVAELSLWITKYQLQKTGSDDEFNMIDELDDISEEEALKLLEAKKNRLEET